MRYSSITCWSLRTAEPPWTESIRGWAMVYTLDVGRRVNAVRSDMMLIVCWCFLCQRLSNLWDWPFCASMKLRVLKTQSLVFQSESCTRLGCLWKSCVELIPESLSFFQATTLDRVYVFKFWIWTWCEPVRERLLRKPLNDRFVSLVVAGVKVVDSPWETTFGYSKTCYQWQTNRNQKTEVPPPVSLFWRAIKWGMCINEIRFNKCGLSITSRCHIQFLSTWLGGWQATGSFTLPNTHAKKVVLLLRLEKGRVLSVFLGNNDTCAWYLTHINVICKGVMDVIIIGGRRGSHAKGKEWASSFKSERTDG